LSSIFLRDQGGEEAAVGEFFNKFFGIEALSVAFSPIFPWEFTA